MSAHCHGAYEAWQKSNETSKLFFFDRRGIVHSAIVPSGQTVNQVFFIKKGSEKVIHMRPDIADKWMLHHDNAPCHTALSITELFISKGIPVVPQPPIHLTWAPVTFYFFLNLKMSTKDIILALENIQKGVTDTLKTILVEDF